MDQASLYARSNALQRRDAAAALAAYIPRMSWSMEEETVLDVGCGSGDITRNLLLPVLPEWVSKVVGVDVSKDMVEFASKHSSHNSIDYVQLDIENDDNPRQRFPGGFTKVISLYCLHWVHNQQACLENVHALLRPGGEALLVFLASNPLFAAYEYLSMDDKWAPYMKDVSKFVPVYQHRKDPAKVFIETAEDAGFEVVSCQAPKMSYVFENANYLKNAVKAVNPFIPRMPEEEQDEFLKACLQQVSAGGARDERGNTRARYTLMVAHLYRPIN